MKVVGIVIAVVISIVLAYFVVKQVIEIAKQIKANKTKKGGK